MNVLNTANSNTQILSSIDNKIQIKHHKEKNKNKTCVYGLFNFISEDDAKIFIKIVKKKLGCSGIIGDDLVVSKPLIKSAPKSNIEPGKVLIFSGNHIDDIKNIILEKNITDLDHIKV